MSHLLQTDDITASRHVKHACICVSLHEQSSFIWSYASFSLSQPPRSFGMLKLFDKLYWTTKAGGFVNGSMTSLSTPHLKHTYTNIHVYILKIAKTSCPNKYNYVMTEEETGASGLGISGPTEPVLWVNVKSSACKFLSAAWYTTHEQKLPFGSFFGLLSATFPT